MNRWHTLWLVAVWTADKDGFSGFYPLNSGNDAFGTRLRPVYQLFSGEVDLYPAAFREIDDDPQKLVRPGRNRSASSW